MDPVSDRSCGAPVWNRKGNRKEILFRKRELLNNSSRRNPEQQKTAKWSKAGVELTKNITESGRDANHNADPISYEPADPIYHAPTEYCCTSAYGINHSQGKDKIKKRGWITSSLFIDLD